MMKRNLVLIILVSVVLFVFGCQQKQEDVEAVKAEVIANQAYIEHFGPAPQVKEGRAFAAVGYLPLKSQPDKLSALPMFMFTDKKQLENTLKKLISGQFTDTQKSDYLNPFPKSIELEVTPVDGDSLSLDLKSDENWLDKDQAMAVHALKETALQFNSFKSVQVSLNGVPFPGSSEAGYQHDPKLIVETPPPSLILLAGAWEEGHDHLEEIMIEFDRPVKMQSFKLFHEDGSEVEGDYFTSVFQMAVIVQPKTPDKFAEGTILKAAWNVKDYLGKENSGTDSLPLRKYLH